MKLSNAYNSHFFFATKAGKPKDPNCQDYKPETPVFTFFFFVTKAGKPKDPNCQDYKPETPMKP